MQVFPTRSNVPVPLWDREQRSLDDLQSERSGTKVRHRCFVAGRPGESSGPGEEQCFPHRLLMRIEWHAKPPELPGHWETAAISVAALRLRPGPGFSFHQIACLPGSASAAVPTSAALSGE